MSHPKNKILSNMEAQNISMLVFGAAESNYVFFFCICIYGFFFCTVHKVNMKFNICACLKPRAPVAKMVSSVVIPHVGFLSSHVWETH